MSSKRVCPQNCASHTVLSSASSLSMMSNTQPGYTPSKKYSVPNSLTQYATILARYRPGARCKKLSVNATDVVLSFNISKEFLDSIVPTGVPLNVWISNRNFTCLIDWVALQSMVISQHWFLSKRTLSTLIKRKD